MTKLKLLLENRAELQGYMRGCLKSAQKYQDNCNSFLIIELISAQLEWLRRENETMDEIINLLLAERKLGDNHE